MCGILAISSAGGEKFNIERSLEAIRHRGPDDRGLYFSEACDGQLGHVRLSIIDLTSAGHQPMVDSTGRYIIVYNGEIYNYIDLKRKLEDKFGEIKWHSTSDTELILEGFSREGYTFFSKLNGIFAFAIYDKVDRSLHVLRDPIGIKPLYYIEQDGSMFFCSELKGLLALSHLKVRLRQQSLADQLLFMFVPEPFTMYEEIFKVEPGIYYVYRYGKQISKTALFSNLSDPILFSSELDMIDTFRETFSSSVDRQLISDVPVSIMLSGGIDSSSIAYEAVKRGGNIKTAYTISFNKKDSFYDKQSSDLYYAKIIAKQLNLNLQVFDAKPEFVSLLPSLMPFLEDGISDPAAISTFLICESARKDGVKVLLSGQGADEYLCGYRRHLAERSLQNMSIATRKILSLADSILPSSVPGKFNALIRRLKRLAVASRLPKNERFPGYFMWSSPENISNLFLDNKSISPGISLFQLFEEHNFEDPLEALLLADQKFDLLSLNLAYGDKMSMMAGVESRVPFLDLEMVQLMNSIPINMKLKGNEQKYILKKAMEPYLPKEVIYRQKAGFALPIRSWFKKRNDILGRYFDPEHIRKQGIFKPEEFEKILRMQYSGKSDNSYLLFSMLCQQIWLDQNFSI